MYHLKNEILTHWKDTDLKKAEVENARKRLAGLKMK
jgi:hypothetical protein